MKNWDRDNPPEHPRPYKGKVLSELYDIVRSFPEDYRLSSRINWENEVTAAYAEIGYRMMKESIVIGLEPRREEYLDDNGND